MLPPPGAGSVDDAISQALRDAKRASSSAAILASSSGSAAAAAGARCATLGAPTGASAMAAFKSMPMPACR